MHTSTRYILLVLLVAASACASTSTPDPVDTPAEVPGAKTPNTATPTTTTKAPPKPGPDGMITTASGLKYQVIKPGNGRHPERFDTVSVHYHGTLLSGAVFDSSVERGSPTSFRLNQVIRGWTEGLQLMRVGGKFKFVIPPELAYGKRSPSPKIPPNSTLVFEVELLAIK